MWKVVLNEAKRYVGVREGSIEHHKLVDKYNAIKPLPRGYWLDYNDSWCAAFVSVIAKDCGLDEFPFECGVWEMEEGLKKRGLKHTSPEPGDIVIFEYSHCGIVAWVDKILGTFASIEGNANNMVMEREHKIAEARFYGAY